MDLDKDEEEVDMAVWRKGEIWVGLEISPYEEERTRSVSPLWTTLFMFWVVDDNEKDNNGKAITFNWQESF